jgi:hypothetical protein
MLLLYYTILLCMFFYRCMLFLYYTNLAATVYVSVTICVTCAAAARSNTAYGHP